MSYYMLSFITIQAPYFSERENSLKYHHKYVQAFYVVYFVGGGKVKLSILWKIQSKGERINDTWKG